MSAGRVWFEDIDGGAQHDVGWWYVQRDGETGSRRARAGAGETIEDGGARAVSLLTGWPRDRIQLEAFQGPDSDQADEGPGVRWRLI